MSKVDGALLDQVEADVYWCLTKLLDNIQVRVSVSRVERPLLFLPQPRPPLVGTLLLAALLSIFLLFCCRLERRFASVSAEPSRTLSLLQRQRTARLCGI